MPQPTPPREPPQNPGPPGDAGVELALRQLDETTVKLSLLLSQAERAASGLSREAARKPRRPS